MKSIRGVLFCCCASLAFAAEDPRFEQGARFESLGQYEKALGEYRSILASDPHNAKAFCAAGTARFKMNDYKGAIANYRLALKHSPQMQAASEGIAKSCEKLGKARSTVAECKTETPKKEAAPKVENVAKNAADSKYSYSSAAFLKAKQAFNAKEYKTACSAAREVLLKEPGNPGAYYYAGAGRYELGEYDKAEYNLKRSFDYPELGYNAHYYLSLIYRKQGKKTAEKEELEKYVTLSKNETALAQAKSRIAELSGQEQKTVTETPVTSTQPEKPKAPEAVEENRSEVAAAPEVKPAAKPEPKPAANTLESANEAFRAGDFSAALSQYQALLKKSRDENVKAFVLLQIGNVYRNRRDYRSAVAKFRESVELYPNSEWANEASRAWEDAVWQQKNADNLPR